MEDDPFVKVFGIGSNEDGSPDVHPTENVIDCLKVMYPDDELWFYSITAHVTTRVL
jgi:hypothetical protein